MQPIMHAVLKLPYAVKWVHFWIPQKLIANLFSSVLCYLFTATNETVYLLFEVRCIFIF